jgi:hypothetical protein
MIIGFWVLTLPYRDEIRGYYYDNLYPIVALLAAMAISKIRWLKIIVGGLIVVNIYQTIKIGVDYWKENATGNVARWNFYEAMAKDVLTSAGGREFGYFAWTSDMLGYSSKYAMQYFTKKNGTTIYPYEKKEMTYLLIAPNEATYNPDANPEFWQKAQVRIERDADEEWEYDGVNYEQGGFRVKKYNLSAEEINEKADENLIKGLEFR